MFFEVGHKKIFLLGHFLFFFFAWVQKYLEKVFSVENLVKVIAFDSVILDKNFDWLSLKILMFFGTQFSVEMDSEAYFSKKKINDRKSPYSGSTYDTYKHSP